MVFLLTDTFPEIITPIITCYCYLLSFSHPELNYEILLLSAIISAFHLTNSESLGIHGHRGDKGVIPPDPLRGDEF